MGKQNSGFLQTNLMYRLQQFMSLVMFRPCKLEEKTKKRVQFRLVDTEGNNIACCLWENYAEQLEPFTEDKDQSIVCLIRFAKIKDFRGEVQITNAFDATRLYLNPMIPELTDLTERLSDDHLSVALVDKHDGKKDGKRIKDDWNDAEIKSTAEVNEANQSIVGVKAEELWDGSYEEIEDPEILPEHILSLVGKFFCFGLSISSDNVTNGAVTFVVVEVCSGAKVLSIENGSYSFSGMATTSSTMSSGSTYHLLPRSCAPRCPDEVLT
ncbi:hypothetical protein IGI04_014883 [Brassica rapa subsp. trilocularis]|uniref:OB domain-containing protein n=1 Tax=Brassica rapa subsp. trilocularis TaxID=1813537 RepID=A0ABQ7MNF6_BRACM|nr:hypothetical protein IGI04_014883 [Brassica rapa subsp. trilocularis]